MPYTYEKAIDLGYDHKGALSMLEEKCVYCHVSLIDKSSFWTNAGMECTKCFEEEN
ncbi:hypothetical protein [Bacillus sp. B1-b2]|uniref:hypothetical protein n=1 Tax=Bacillus sp. B1-b2 TaxID=2653201 RepID=UPI001869FF5E|nr:hypothetical protein [Bacillus sp. B1-b2]